MYSSQNYRPFRWFRIAVGVFLGLVLAAIVAGLVFAFLRPTPFAVFPRFGFFWFPFGFFGAFFIFFLLFALVRWIFFPWGGWGWWGGRGYYRRRYYYDDPALQVLRERYARGEITKEQFDQMMRDLQQPPPGGSSPAS
jgi:putative membrane protein